MAIRYTPGEERWNTWSHAGGILLGVAVGIVFLTMTIKGNSNWARIGVVLYLFGMLGSYISSTAYHALRLKEGVFTAIKPIDRRRTMRHLRAAGLPLMTGVEPVWDGVSAQELSERIMDIPDFSPFCIGACSITEVEGVDVAGKKPAKTGFVRYVGALTRLACGEEVPVGGIGGVAWVDAGCDPRNRELAEGKRRPQPEDQPEPGSR